MGEIFKYERSATKFEFTGERFTTAVGGEIELEHIHRYLMARSLCRGKSVLDIACGEGYGSAMLAQVARNVIGVDVDNATVVHAARSYRRANLRFVQGDARYVPMPDASVDVVTSFETLEHFFEQEKFLREVFRILRPDGFLIISTPDRDVYSPSGRAANRFHVRELSRDEFASQLSHFPTVLLFQQRPLVGSLIASQAKCEYATSRLVTYDKRDETHFEENMGLARAVYLIAVASKARLVNADLFSSVFIDTNRVDSQASEVAAARLEITGLQERNASVQREVTRLRESNAGALRESVLFERLCGHLTEELDAIRSSSCWRLTRPIREIGGRFPLLARSLKCCLRAILYPLRKARGLLAQS
jgi:ubiquinone/menaquinone biosynthesis C-methylase UbiE